MITLFGATGYTGSRVAARLDREGLPFRIAGRSQERLKILSDQLSSHPDMVVADARDPLTIPALFNGTSLLINCVGPFTDLGERVVRQAAVSGVNYLDSTNELGFVYRMQTYHRLAAQSGAVLVPSCAFEVALADCGAAVLSRSFPGPYDEAIVVYHLPGVGSSRGTRRSALRSMATSWITFPAHLSVRSVSTWMTVSPVTGFLGPIFLPFAARFLRSIAGPWIQNLVRSHISQDGDGEKEYSTFEIQINLTGSGTNRTLTIIGRKPYEITADILTLAAKKISATGFDKKGLLPPSAVLGCDDFFEMMRPQGIDVIR